MDQVPPPSPPQMVFELVPLPYSMSTWPDAQPTQQVPTTLDLSSTAHETQRPLETFLLR